jgi:hypothetical protein
VKVDARGLGKEEDRDNFTLPKHERKLQAPVRFQACGGLRLAMFQIFEGTFFPKEV